MRSTRLSLSSITLCVAMAVSFGCSSHRWGFETSASALGTYPATSSMTNKYGIVEWRIFLGRTQIVYTGYRADGTPSRGVSVAWYKATSSMPAHTKVSMLDGTGAALRRMVGGGMTGHLSADQKLFVETLKYDVTRATQGTAGTQSFGSGGFHTMDFTTQSSGSPNGGPDCQAAQMQQAQDNNALDCSLDTAGVIMDPETAPETAPGAAYSCANWHLDSEHTQSVCDAENLTSCDVNGENCNFPDAPSSDAGAAPQQQCDAQCLCANYPDSAQGCGQVGPCSADSDCTTSGETCQGGTCKPGSADALTDDNTSTENPSAASCKSGDVSTDSSNGDVGCSSDANSGSSGGSGGTDPGTDNGGGTSGGGDNSGTNDTCANDGDSCAADSDCCGGTCSNGTCGAGGGTTCGNPGDSCGSDSDCCSSSCDPNYFYCN